MNELNEIQSKSEQKYLILVVTICRWNFNFRILWNIHLWIFDGWGSLIYIDESENETWNAEILPDEQTKFNYQKTFSTSTSVAV